MGNRRPQGRAPGFTRVPGVGGGGGGGVHHDVSARIRVKLGSQRGTRSTAKSVYIMDRMTNGNLNNSHMWSSHLRTTQ